MRFGELLLSTQIVEWADKYLSYNQLKSCINDIVQEKLDNLSVSPVASPSIGSPITPRLNAEGYPILSAEGVPSHANYESFLKFKKLLDKDIEVLESTYSEKLSLLKLELDYLLLRKEAYSRSEGGLESVESFRALLEPKILQQYVECLKLESFARVNLLGLAKLLKKHDKLVLGNPLLVGEYMDQKIPNLSISSHDKLGEVVAGLTELWKFLGQDASLLESSAKQDKALAPRKLPFDISDRYTTFLLDMDGVIYHGNRMLPGVAEFVSWLHERGKKFLFLTNSSDKTPEMLSAKLEGMGIKVSASHFFTSALSTAAFLAQQTPPERRTAYVIGEKGLLDALLVQGFTISESSPEYVVVGETSEFNFSHITKATNLVRGGSRLIGTNLDSVDKVENGFNPSVGSLIAPIQIATDARPYFLGKPNPLMFLSALNMVQSKRSETVMIGDRMDTDIVGGLESNIGTILVLSGVTTMADLAKFQFVPHYVLRGVDELVQVLYANTPSRKDLLCLSGKYTDSLESLVS